MSTEARSLAAIEEVLGHRFEQPSLLQQALRHGSALTSGREGTYQRLEFLGDAVIGHAVALLLYDRFPDQDQGGLTRMRSHLTRSASLAEQAYLLGLEQHAEIGPSEELSGGRRRQALLEDLFEALVGAMTLDGGWEVAFDFIQRRFASQLDGLDERTLVLADPKTALQEAAQAQGLALPAYSEVGASGPDHSRRWAFAVIWDGEEIARGEGPTKRRAQKQAARRALTRLGLLPAEL